MALFRDRTTGMLVTLAQAKLAAPNVSFGTSLTPTDFTMLNIDPVLPAAKPTRPQPYDRIVNAPPVQNSNGDWVQAFTIVDPTVNATTAQLVTIKTNLAATLSAQFDNTRAALFAAGYNNNFAGFNDNNGHPCGVLTLQMDANSQINWLGVTALAQLEVAAASTATMMIRTAQNIDVVMPPTAVITLMAAVATWKTLVVLTAGGLKSQLAAAIATTATTPLQMTAIVWPTATTATPPTA
jgi:hypothetical protein